MAEDEKVFIKISNQDIYEEMKNFHVRNAEQHEQIIRRLDMTNGRVKLGKWIATTALAIALIAIGYLFTHLSNIVK